MNAPIAAVNAAANSAVNTVKANTPAIAIPLTSFLSQFAFVISAVAIFVYTFVNRNVKITEMLWHLMFVGTFVWNTECLASDKKCEWMAGLSMIYPIIYLITFTYFNMSNAIAAGSSEKRDGVLDESASDNMVSDQI